MKKTMLILFSFISISCCMRPLVWFPERIKAYNTNDPGRPYKTLGIVEATYVPPGFYSSFSPPVTNMERNYEKYGDTKWHKETWTPKYEPKLSPEIQEANRILLDTAYDRYGSVLGAVINVRYSTSVEYYSQNGVVDQYKQRMHTKAIGLAICFVDSQNRCINFDDPDSSKTTVAKPDQQSPIQEENPPIIIEEKKPIATQLEKPLIPNNILGNDIRESNTSTEYGRFIKGFKKAYEYEYGAFHIRIIEFNSQNTAANFLAAISRLSNVRKIEKEYYWETGAVNCIKCSNLAYQFDKTKIITIYPDNQTLNTALKAAKVLRKR